MVSPVIHVIVSTDVCFSLSQVTFSSLYAWCISFFCCNQLPRTQRLKTTQFINVRFCRLEGLVRLKSTCHQLCIPFWRLQRRNCFLAFSNFSVLPAFLGLWPSSVFKASNGGLNPSHINHFNFLFCLPHPPLRTLVIILGPLNHPVLSLLRSAVLQLSCYLQP